MLKGLGKSKKNVWKWIMAISDSLSTSFFDELIRSSAKNKLDHDSNNSIYLAYYGISSLGNKIRELGAKYSFYQDNKIKQNDLDEDLRFIGNWTEETLEHIQAAMKKLYDFRTEKGYKAKSAGE